MSGPIRTRCEDHQDEEWADAHLAHKAEHVVDVETDVIFGVTVQDADEGETTTRGETLIDAVAGTPTFSSNC